MGYDSNNHLPIRTNKNPNEVKEFLQILGYKPIKKDVYYFFRYDNYKIFKWFKD